MTIDPAGQRANDTGWTKEALKAEQDARRAAKRKADKARNKAEFQAKVAAVKAWVWGVWDFFLRNMVLWLALAGVIAIGAWEWWNTSRGWTNLYPGLPPLAPYIGALGAVVLYFHSFREMRDHYRAKRTGQGNIWVSVTVAAYLVCVTGVFIATATAAEKAERVAKDSKTFYNRIVLARDKLQAKVDLNDPEFLKLARDADATTLSALEDTAKTTYQMPDLKLGSGCPAPPKKFVMERLCAQANGGIDPFNGEVLQGIRHDLEMDDKRLRDAEADVEDLKILNNQVRDFHVVQGDETAAALGQMFSVEGGTAMGWILLVLSSLFLYGGGWLGDWVFERIEAMRLAARAAKGATP